MNDKEKSGDTQLMMKCENCGYRAIQSEVDENEGKCPSCKEKFHPIDESS